MKRTVSEDFLCICVFQCLWKFHLPMWKSFSAQFFENFSLLHLSALNSCRLNKRKKKSKWSSPVVIIIVQIKSKKRSIFVLFSKKPLAFIFVYLAILSFIFSFICSIKGKVWGKFLGRFFVRAVFDQVQRFVPVKENCLEDFLSIDMQIFLSIKTMWLISSDDKIKFFFLHIHRQMNEMKIRLGLLIISLKSFSSVYQCEFKYMIKIIIDSKIFNDS